ncbi:tRNA-modifying protein YgfZ [Prochlorococcus sp. MIT 1223]|uniref:CAF17-like 4Fe-4S cluster assembly/insertion protein YgfZ n=1 Tax=Prochlorococcus sp. MIT 1223 TaxID=3096217 RepID=UPI002A74ECA7|nr:tRNA-modifying protein YgfZ [Prochlorococcus sp. MIT 1223]
MIKLTGEGVRQFLHGQTSADIIGAHKEDFIKACCLSNKGKVRALIEIKLNSIGADILVLSGSHQEVLEGFDRVIFPADRVHIKSIDCIRRVQKISLEETWKESIVRWIGDKKSIDNIFKGFRLATLKEVESWRIMQGIPLSEKDISSASNPIELGLIDLIDSNKGCYLGQEIISKLIRVGLVNKQIRFWESNHEIKVNTDLVDNKKESIAGIITSSCKISDKKTIGLAMIKRQYLKYNTLFSVNSYHSISLKIPISFAQLNNDS